MIWTDNLIKYSKDKDAGICPLCKKGHVSVSLTQVNKWTHYLFTCEECKAHIQVDGINKED